HGRKLKGRFALVRMQGRKFGNKDNWLLIKMRDDAAQSAPDGEEPSPKQKTTRGKKAASRLNQPKQRSAPPANGVALTHADKIMYPDANISKADVFEYYQKIAPRLLPHLKDRPVTLERLPDGLDGAHKPHFWQKNTPATYPEWIPRIALTSEDGKEVAYALVNNEETLLYLVNQGTLTFHVWFSRVANLDRPDFVLFDLDPGQAAFTDVVAIARKLHTILEEDGWSGYLKTSGKT